MEDVRFNDFINKLVKMNEDDINYAVSKLDEETQIRVIQILEGGKLPFKIKISPDIEVRSQAAVNDLAKQVGAAKPAADLDVADPNSLRAKALQGPAAKNPRAAADAISPPSSQPRPAADVKAGSLRDAWAQGKTPDAAMREKGISEPPVSKVKVSDQPNPDAAMKAKGIEEPKAAAAPKKDATNKVVAGLAGATAVAAAAGYGASTRQSETPPSAGATPPAAAPAASNLKPASVMPDKPAFQFGSKKGGIVSAAELNKYREHVGNKNVTLGQYMNARDNKTAITGGKNDPQQIMKAKGLDASQVYRPEQIKAGLAQRSGPAVPVKPTLNVPPNAQAAYASKKLREENDNSLIASFLKIQSLNSPNLFEAAKKAKKDWDKDGKIESGKDEYLGSRIRAAKAAGNMKEESEGKKDAEKNPMSHERDAGTLKKPLRQLTPDEMPVSKVERTGKQSSTAYKIKEESEKINEGISSFSPEEHENFSKMSKEEKIKHYNKLITLSRSNTGTKKGFDAYKAYNEFGKRYLPKKIYKEEVEFSEAELAHIASILEANPVAPVPDDYSGAAGGVSKRDLSDETVAEAKSKKKK